LREPKFKLEAVAEELGVAPSTLSRIETGKAPTKTIYLMKMLDMYGVDDPAQRQVLIDMAREGHRKGWWAEYDDVLPSGFGIYVGLETEAERLRVYETDLVHGLLQTPDYARAVLREVNPRDSDEQIERLVDLRMARQDVLNNEPPLDLWVIHDEGVIKRTIGGASVMRRQLERMIEADGQPGMTLQLLPFGSGAHAGLSGPFSILEFPERTDPEVAYVESVAGIIYLEKEREVRSCIDAFDRLRAQALSPSASAELIADALKNV
jgi:transcriptional regulator with XRE-family HTH domain